MKRTAFVQFFYFRNLLSGKRVCRMTAMIAPKLAWTIWNGSLSIAAFGVASVSYTHLQKRKFPMYMRWVNTLHYS